MPFIRKSEMLQNDLHASLTLNCKWLHNTEKKNAYQIKIHFILFAPFFFIFSNGSSYRTETSLKGTRERKKVQPEKKECCLTHFKSS